MDFNEKLQQLRKEKGLTQEQLAEILYVSRTAISKWESGRGYPCIESLKDISQFFNVSIDELLNAETLISLAKKENEHNIKKLCSLLIAILDIFVIILIIFPLYPHQQSDFITCVNLFQYTNTSLFNRIIYWILYLSIIMIGSIKCLFIQFNKENKLLYLTNASMLLSIINIIVLALTKETYALILIFLLFLLKTILLFTSNSSYSFASFLKNVYNDLEQ